MNAMRTLVALAIALAAAFAAVGAAGRWLAAPGPKTVPVAVAAADISAGERLAVGMLKLVDWPQGSLPAGSFSQIEPLASRVARMPLARGEPVLEARLAPPGATLGLSALVAEGRRAMTVRVNDVIGVAGFALPGNYVDILVSTQDELQAPGERARSISKLVLERILVLAVAQEASASDAKPRVVNAVTLEVTPQQAELLDLARSVGQLSLVLRNQVDTAPARTGGATKRSLLQLAQEAPPRPAPPRASAIAKRCAEVFTGSGPVLSCE
jgi:pilus assembly protein CpaB